LLFVFLTFIVLFSSVRDEQFPTIQRGLVLATEILEAHWWDNVFKSTHISKDIVQQFIKFLSSKNDKSSFSILFQFLQAPLSRSTRGAHPVFSVTLSSSLLRIVTTGRSLVAIPALSLYSTITERQSVEQKRQVANSDAWPILISLLTHENDDVVEAVAKTLKCFVADRTGEDYAKFIDEGLFEVIMNCILPLHPGGPPPSSSSSGEAFAPVTSCRLFSRDFFLFLAPSQCLFPGENHSMIVRRLPHMLLVLSVPRFRIPSVCQN
jgi:hypothetical protein